MEKFSIAFLLFRVSFPLFFPVSFLLHNQREGTAELIRTRCRLGATTYAMQFSNHVAYRHSFYQRAYSLQISVAATIELHVFDFAVFNIKYGKFRRVPSVRYEYFIVILFYKSVENTQPGKRRQL